MRVRLLGVVTVCLMASAGLASEYHDLAFGRRHRVILVETQRDRYYSLSELYAARLIADELAGYGVGRKVARDRADEPAEDPQPPALKTVKAAGPYAAACVGCHSGAKPKGGLDLSGPLTAKQAAANARVVVTGRMPVGRKLSDDEQTAVVEDMMAKLAKGNS